MSELLFQNELISWTSPWISSLSLSVGVFVCILSLIAWNKYKKNYTPPKMLHPYLKIWESDSDYVSKTLESLKEYLLERKSPHHVTAHTADEIARYIDDNELEGIIHELEHIEYSGRLLSLTDRTAYNERIEKALEVRD
jgi:hypothetical protein